MSIYALYLLCGILPTDRRSLLLLGMQTLVITVFVTFALVYAQCGANGNPYSLGRFACCGSLFALCWPLLPFFHGNAVVDHPDDAATACDKRRIGTMTNLLKASPELAALASSLSWAIYGATLQFNMNIFLPNVISAFFSLIQLIGRKKNPIPHVDAVPFQRDLPMAKDDETNTTIMVHELHLIQIPGAVDMRSENVAISVQ